MLLLAHLDVVEAKRDDWTYDPFVLTEKDGYFYGRGTQDVKGGAAMLVTALLRMKQEKFVPDRDLILALTAGEEGGMPYNGVQWLIANKKPLIDAEYVINVDAGGGELENGKHTLFDVQAAEKVYHSVSLTAKNPGGHSSLPRKDNAIYELAEGARARRRVRVPGEAERRREEVLRAGRVDGRARRSPPTCEAVVRGNRDAGRDRSAQRDAALQRVDAHDVRRDDARAAATRRTRCRKPPPRRSTAACFQATTRPRVEQALVRAIGDTGVHLAPIDTARPSPASPLRPDVFSAVEASVKALWGNVPIVPIMETGATDGLYLRNAGVPCMASAACSSPRTTCARTERTSAFSSRRSMRGSTSRTIS